MSSYTSNDYGEKFDLWCKVYDPMELELSFVKKAIGPPPRRVLDVGAGTGRLAIPLLSAGYEVTAVDNDPRLLEVVRATANDLPECRDRLTIIHDEFTSCTMTPEFDVIIFSWVLGLLGDRESVLRKAESLTNESKSPCILVIQGCGGSDYAQIVSPFLKKRDGDEPPKKKPARRTIGEMMPDWQVYDYGLHDVPYVFHRFEDVYTVFEFALLSWHGVPPNSLNAAALREKLQEFRRGNLYCITERVNLVYLYRNELEDAEQEGAFDGDSAAFNSRR